MRRTDAAGWGLLLAALVVVGIAAGMRPPVRAAAQVAAAGIAVEGDGEIGRLIGQLGDDAFAVREGAQRRLEGMGMAAYQAVRRAQLTSKDPEIVSRLGQVEAALARETYWNGTETIAEYAKRMGNKEAERTVEIGVKKAPLKLVLIPSGEFVMGSPEVEAGHLETERQHKVRIDRAFYMGSATVTQSQWKAVMGTEPSGFKGDNLPVEMISWTEAAAFCAALTKQMGEGGGRGIFRLPTEAEWEWACRAGTTTAFNFGAVIDTAHANYQGKPIFEGARPPEYRLTTVTAGTFKANQWGLYDMHGNVWQWCSDWFGAYPVEEVANPTGAARGEQHVVRGGSWTDVWNYLRAAAREPSPPDRRTMHIGMRVVMEIGD